MLTNEGLLRDVMELERLCESVRQSGDDDTKARMRALLLTFEAPTGLGEPVDRLVGFARDRLARVMLVSELQSETSPPVREAQGALRTLGQQLLKSELAGDAE